MGENDKHAINFEKICRLCLYEKRTLTEIFESTADNNNLSIDQKIMACATIDVSAFQIEINKLGHILIL